VLILLSETALFSESAQCFSGSEMTSWVSIRKKNPKWRNLLEPTCRFAAQVDGTVLLLDAFDLQLLRLLLLLLMEEVVVVVEMLVVLIVVQLLVVVLVEVVVVVAGGQQLVERVRR